MAESSSAPDMPHVPVLIHAAFYNTALLLTSTKLLCVTDHGVFFGELRESSSASAISRIPFLLPVALNNEAMLLGAGFMAQVFPHLKVAYVCAQRRYARVCRVEDKGESRGKVVIAHPHFLLLVGAQPSAHGLGPRLGQPPADDGHVGCCLLEDVTAL